MLLEKYNFNGVTLINQALLVLYAYTSNTGIVCDLGEKIDILPICNGNNNFEINLIF
jgi:actin-related protein